MGAGPDLIVWPNPRSAGGHPYEGEAGERREGTGGRPPRPMAEVLDEVDGVVRFEVEARPDTPYERWPGWPHAGYPPRYEIVVR